MNTHIDYYVQKKKCDAIFLEEPLWYYLHENAVLYLNDTPRHNIKDFSLLEQFPAKLQTDYCLCKCYCTENSTENPVITEIFTFPLLSPLTHEKIYISIAITFNT